MGSHFYRESNDEAQVPETSRIYLVLVGCQETFESGAQKANGFT